MSTCACESNGIDDWTLVRIGSLVRVEIGEIDTGANTTSSGSTESCGGQPSPHHRASLVNRWPITIS